MTEACEKTQWQVQAYCLMGIHLLREWGIPKDSTAGWGVLGKRMERRRGEDLYAESKRAEREPFTGKSREFCP